MSKVAFESDLGTLPLQHHGYATEELNIMTRHCVKGVRMLGDAIKTDTMPERIHDERTRGDITAGCYLHPTSRIIGGWRFGGWPAAMHEPEKFLPIRDGKWTVDERFVPEPVTFSPLLPLKIPAGMPLIVLDSQDENEQHCLGFPSGGVLVAHWRGNGPNTASTYVYDLTGDELDLAHRARIDTAWRVSLVELSDRDFLAFGESKTVAALNMTRNAQGRGYGAAWWDRIVGYMSHERGGPMHPGSAFGDKHNIGVNAEGDTINPAHLWTGARFYMAPGLDDELRFEPLAWSPGLTTPYVMAVNLRKAPGDWAWQSYSIWAPPDQPPEDPPGEPPEDPTGKNPPARPPGDPQPPKKPVPPKRPLIAGTVIPQPLPPVAGTFIPQPIQPEIELEGFGPPLLPPGDGPPRLRLDQGPGFSGEGLPFPLPGSLPQPPISPDDEAFLDRDPADDEGAAFLDQFSTPQEGVDPLPDGKTARAFQVPIAPGDTQQRGRTGARTHAEAQSPGLLAKAQAYWIPGQDLRHIAMPSNRALRVLCDNPVQGRLESFGQFDSRGVPVHVRGPQSDRYKGGAGVGGFALIPAPWDMADYRTGETRPAAVNTPRTQLALMGEDTDLRWANLYRDDLGQATRGWFARLDDTTPATPDLCISPMDANGDPSAVGTLKLLSDVAILGNLVVGGGVTATPNFSYHRISAGDTVTIRAKQQMTIHGPQIIEAGGIQIIEADAQLILES